MSTDAALRPPSEGNQRLFWGCFIALITTSFAFFSRMYLCDVRFGGDFGLDKVAIGKLKGAGIWPFAISIILFSLVIDRIGYRIAMFFSFICYAIYLVLACMAYAAVQGLEGEALKTAQIAGYNYLYLGSIILALGNGTVEAFINPVVATIFTREKTKWLNILHAGWPGGLVIGGILTIFLAETAKTGDWRIVVGIIAVPAVIYLLMLTTVRFPKSEREQAGVSYREMLAEFGAFGALVGFGLIFMELSTQFATTISSAAASLPALQEAVTNAVGAENIATAEAAVKQATEDANTQRWMFIGIATAIVTAIFGFYTRSFGRGLLAFLIIIMMPLATTEIGTDGWISGLMEEPMKDAGYNAGWVLVYTSAIMMVLRFFAGSIVHKLSPIGLLIVSAVLAIAGLFALSKTGNSGLAVIFLAATLYGFGKTFFWPTMLGITAEQCPKGGALTLNAISGIGMIAVGVLGFPFIGYVQEDAASKALAKDAPVVAENVLKDAAYMGVPYKAIDGDKFEAVEAAVKESEKTETPDPENSKKLEDLKTAKKTGQFEALAIMALFPAFMLICYIVMFLYFKSKGGYQAEVLAGHAAEDERFTGGVAGPADH